MLWILAAWAVLRSMEILRYREGPKAYRAIVDKGHLDLVRDGDYIYQAATMWATWCEIALLMWSCARWPGWPAAAVAALFVAGRFRALQEVGHTALHLGFGRHKRAQRWLADVFGHYLLFKADSERRFQSHCVEHHPNANTERDPNIVRLRRIGLVPGISRARFLVLMFHPLTPAGTRETLAMMWGSLGPWQQVLARAVLNAAAMAGVWWAAGPWGLGAYLVALLWIYPLFSWWSLLVEHRWWVAADERQSRIGYDCEVGRRTVYGMMSGFLVRILVCPLTDSYHLAHHIYPRMHWKYMRVADRALCEVNPAYRDGASYGLVMPARTGRVSAISELYQRLVHG